LLLLFPIKISFIPYYIDPITYEVSKYKNKNLLMAMIEVESNFNRKAISKKGAVGLLQIRPSVWHKELKEQRIIKEFQDYFTIEKNIKAGNYILVKYQKKYKGDNKKALYYYSGKSKNYYKKVMEKIK
jgi:soluble lytic murein transglycosylase